MTMMIAKINFGNIVSHFQPLTTVAIWKEVNNNSLVQQGQLSLHRHSYRALSRRICTLQGHMSVLRLGRCPRGSQSSLAVCSAKEHIWISKLPWKWPRNWKMRGRSYWQPLVHLIGQ